MITTALASSQKGLISLSSNMQAQFHPIANTHIAFGQALTFTPKNLHNYTKKVNYLALAQAVFEDVCRDGGVSIKLKTESCYLLLMRLGSFSQASCLR